MEFKRALQVMGGGASVALVTAFISTAPAHAEQACDYAAATGKYSCAGSSQVRGEHDVVGAKLFEGDNFGGDSLTIWIPKPCVKNGKVDYQIHLGSELRKKISSVQGWGGKNGCWVWLDQEDGSRDGPFSGNVSDVGSHANNQAVEVGLS